jgi:cytochrome c-type biogenesis protein CcmH/NrfF
MKRILFAAGMALLLVSPCAAQAPTALPPQGSASDNVAREAMALIRSPFFVAHTLDMCPNAGSDVLRDSVRMAAASGMTRDQIIEDFVARHGEQLRLLPRRSGFGLWAWLAPPGLLLMGLGFVTARMRRMRGTGRTSADRELSAQEREELEAALRGFDAREAAV